MKKIYLRMYLSQEKNIKSDFLKSNFVLHRGSNAIISAVKHGLSPIYLEIKMSQI